MPFWYGRHRVKVVLPLNIGAWLASIVHIVVLLRGHLDCYSFSRTVWTCIVSDGSKYTDICRAFWLLSLTLFTLGVFVLYTVMMCKARKLRNKVHVAVEQAKTCSEGREIVTRNRKIDRRANTTFLLLFMASVGVLVPPYLYFAIDGAILQAVGMATPPAFTACSIIMLNIYYLIFTPDPVIMMRNQDVREVIKVIRDKFHGRKRENDTNER